MFKIKLKLENFLAVKEAEIQVNNNIVLLIAPNRAGKTQILQLLYGIFWCIWKIKKDKKEITKELFEREIKKKLVNIFLIKKIDDILQWNGNSANFKINLTSDFLNLQITGPQFELKEFYIDKNFRLDKSAIFIHPAGLGDYYKGIYSLKKYYPDWKLVSEANVDLIHDLFIVYTGKTELTEQYENLLNIFEKLFDSKFFIQNDRIFIQEKNKKYGLERTASGLKSLSWFYLILKYNLLGDILFIDEPEVNLHPVYIDKLAYFLFELSKNKKIFISTHSDYLLESFNKLINKYNFKVDVWDGILKKNNGIYSYYEADKDNLVDTTPLNETYTQIIKELFEYDGDIGL